MRFAVFKYQKFLDEQFEERNGSVFVPTREDYPQAIRPFPQSFQKSTHPVISSGARSLDLAPAFPAFAVTLELLLIFVSDEDVLSIPVEMQRPCHTGDFLKSPVLSVFSDFNAKSALFCFNTDTDTHRTLCSFSIHPN